MRIMFMGTPEISAGALSVLIENGHEVVAVVTGEDKPRGRGNVMTPTPTKKLAEEKGIPVYTPKTLRDEEFASLLSEIDPELICVVAYGKILPENVIKYPKYGCINLHVSLLPKYRGAAPMQRAIMNGEAETGVTIMKMDKGLDTGDMILTVKTPISDTDNLETVHDRLAQISGDALLSAMKLIESGKAVYLKQNDEEATYAEKILKNDEIIDLTNSAKAISNRIRALTPFPYAYCKYNGKMLKIIEARAEEADINGKKPGEILSVKNGEIKVATGEGILVVTKVFPESKRRMNALDFVNGSKIKPGDILE